MTECPNARCEGGWIPVLDGYVERNAPEPELPEGDGPELDAIRAKLVMEYQARCASLSNTWYPCSECNKRMFFRWRGGHLDADHNREDCEECVVPGQRRRAGAPRSLTPTPSGPPWPAGSEEHQF